MLVQIHEVAQQPENKERGLEIGGMVLVNEKTDDVETVITKGEPRRMGTVIDEDNVLGRGHGRKVGKSLALAMVAAEHGWSVKGMAHTHPGRGGWWVGDNAAPSRTQLLSENRNLRAFVVNRFGCVSNAWEDTHTTVDHLRGVEAR
jgi:hypothetical protein